MRTRLNDLFSYIQVLILSFFVNKTYTGQHILRFADRTYSRSFAPLRFFLALICETGCVFSGYKRLPNQLKIPNLLQKTYPCYIWHVFNGRK